MGKKFLVVALAVAIVGVTAPGASAVTLQLNVAARWVGPSGPIPVTEGTVVDPSYNPYILYDVAVRVSEGGDNEGLATAVFKAFSQEMADQGLYMWTFYDSEAGYNNAVYPYPAGSAPALQSVQNPAYPAGQPSPAPAAYGGGWGFDNSGFPTGGVATAPGQVLDAGNSMPLIWSGDNSAILPGLQSTSLMGVGHGSNIGRAEDPNLGGTMLGFQPGPMPQDLANGMVPGDGEWVMMYAFLPLSGMAVEDAKGAILYTVTVTPTAGNYLMLEENFTGESVGKTYYDELQGGFRSEFDNWVGDSFSFYVPEPATIALLTLAGLGLIRRRR
jgi:hypothetical protein